MGVEAGMHMTRATPLGGVSSSASFVVFEPSSLLAFHTRTGAAAPESGR